jgi:hypothetical protein
MMLVFNSCSGTSNAYYQTLKIAFSEQIDAQKSLTEVQQSEVDIILVKRGERPTAIMALAYLENNQHKWVSSDNVMLIMEKGRLIRTLGLDDNRLFVSNTEADPLKSLPHLSPTKDESQRNTWSRKADRANGEYGYPLNSVFSNGQLDNLQAFNFDIETIYYVETVKFQAPANYIRLDNSWKNHFWYSKDGQLLKSLQKISPLSESLEITYLSRIARLK